MDARIVHGVRVPCIRDNLYCLPVLTGFDLTGYPAVEGLLLEEVGSIGKFRCFGTFHAIDTDVTNDIQAGLQYFDASAAETGLEYRDDGKGGYKHIITII
jgi:hypothetical protein